MSVSVKQCNHVLHEGERLLPLSEYHKDARTSDRLRRYCKVCSSRNAAAWRKEWAKDPEWKAKFNAANTISRHKGGKVRQLFGAAMTRARKKGMEFSITVDDIVIPTHCPILGIPIKEGNGRKSDAILDGTDPVLVGARDSSPSIDRIDNNVGYTKDNVLVISWRANYLKNTATLDELIMLGEFAKQMKQQLK